MYRIIIPAALKLPLAMCCVPVSCSLVTSRQPGGTLHLPAGAFHARLEWLAGNGWSWLFRSRMVAVEVYSRRLTGSSAVGTGTSSSFFPFAAAWLMSVSVMTPTGGMDLSLSRTNRSSRTVVLIG